MDSELRFERFWTRAGAVIAAALIGYFVVSELSGLLRLLEWLGQGIATLPSALSVLLAHYASLPLSALILPVCIGGVVGGISTALVAGDARHAAAHRRNIVIGAGMGALSGQILTAALRHCTYALEAPLGETVAGVILTSVSALILLLPIWTLMRRRRSEGTSGYFRRPLLAYGLLAPTLLSLGLFLYFPAAQMVALSLNLRRFPLPQERFVCLGNYSALTVDPIYQTSLLTTVFITVAVVLISLALSLGIAVLASQKIRYAVVYRVILISPFALSPIVTGVLFLALFREGGTGILSFLALQIFGSAPSWLRDPTLARWVIIGASVWNILGFNILFYIAGLQNVPKDLLEAAQIDGATAIQRFARITFPLLSPYTFFLLITNVTYAFYGVYGAIDTLTQGGPPIGAAGQFGGATNVLIYKLYEDGFSPGSPLGLAAAQAVVLFVVVAGLTFLQFQFVERRVTYGE